MRVAVPVPDLVESINCPRCGAPLPLAAGEVIITCPYCGTAARLAGDRPFLLRHAMLVVRLDRAAAEAAIGGWMEGGFLKPNDLRRAARLTSLECTYLPFYVFEVDADTAYAGVLNRTGTREERQGHLVHHYFWKVLGRRSGDFPVLEYKLPLGQKVPFDPSSMVRDARFLNAEVDEDQAVGLAREEVAAHQGELLKDIVDVVEEATTDVVVKDSEFLHAPLWFGGYTYRGRPYSIILDAASGDVVRGDIPPPTGGMGEFLRGAVHRTPGD